MKITLVGQWHPPPGFAAISHAQRGGHAPRPDQSLANGC